MFRDLFDWTLSLIGISREIEEQRAMLRDHARRIRDLEESFKLLVAEMRHDREMAQHEREKLILRLETVLTKQLPPPARKKKRR